MTTSYNPQYDQPNDDEEKHEDDDSIDFNHNDDDESIDFNHNDLDTNGTNTQSQSLSASPHHHNKNNKKMKASSSTSTLSATRITATRITRGASASHLISSSMNNNRKMSRVEKIISITPTCYLKPKSFFVAWNSVITLVFTGWPEPIDTMKTELSSSCTICKEFFGSKFPKITIACVKDGVEMTPKLLSKIRNLCQQFIIPKDYVLCMDALSIVLYENRSQESVIYSKIIPLNKNHKFMGSPRPLLLNMDEEDDAPYLRSANRTSHYRSLVIGSSIVHQLIACPKFIIDFQSLLPKDIFDTFSPHSLHITVRALS